MGLNAYSIRNRVENMKNNEIDYASIEEDEFFQMFRGAVWQLSYNEYIKNTEGLDRLHEFKDSALSLYPTSNYDGVLRVVLDEAPDIVCDSLSLINPLLGMGCSLIRHVSKFVKRLLELNC